jgi:uncharacterized membrane-anchored protein
MVGETDIEVKQGNVELPGGVVESLSNTNTSETNRKDTSMNEKNSMIGIASVVGGSAVGIVTIFAIFAKTQMTYAAVIVGSLCVMGIILGGLASKSKSKE